MIMRSRAPGQFTGPVHHLSQHVLAARNRKMTSEGHRLIDGTRTKHAPTFEVRQMKSAPRWYVRVLWDYGEELHVSGFTSADEARRWIHNTSEGWLRNRSAALRGV